MSFQYHRSGAPPAAAATAAAVAAFPALDENAAPTYVYPTNREVRKYQQDICHTGLFHNTLVCLPTGLGKTLIASVVMYNFWRWFPTGIVVFLAPTKPLVLQQVKACYEVMGIPEEDTAHLDGHVPQEKRRAHWKSRRVFFCTPQTFKNDLETDDVCDPRRVVCVVVDEAHKAKEPTSPYAEAVALLAEVSDHFRVLALSATPGSDAHAVQQVLQHLRIERIEARAEDDPQIVQYTHDKQIEIVMAEKGSASITATLKGDIGELMVGAAHRLEAAGILASSNPATLNPMVVDEARRMLAGMAAGVGYSSLPPSQAASLRADVDELDAIVQLRRALSDGGPRALVQAMEQLQYMASTPSSAMAPGLRATVHGNRFKRVLANALKVQSNSADALKRQPKLLKLREILSEHFVRHAAGGASTRVIVFAGLRATVQEIVTELATELDGVRPREFVGQANKAANSATGASGASGMNQKEQAAVLASFNRGDFNVLVSTSIAEEGLDIAEVDLIVFFESVSSPIRLVQRMGRTGRKRAGRVVILVQSADEAEKLQRSTATAGRLCNALRNPSTLRFFAPKPPTAARPALGLFHASAVQPDHRHMEGVEEFHMSQVAGAGKVSSSSSSSSSSGVAGRGSAAGPAYVPGQGSMAAYLQRPALGAAGDLLPPPHIPRGGLLQAMSSAAGFPSAPSAPPSSSSSSSSSSSVARERLVPGASAFAPMVIDVDAADAGAVCVAMDVDDADLMAIDVDALVARRDFDRGRLLDPLPAPPPPAAASGSFLLPAEEARFRQLFFSAEYAGLVASAEALRLARAQEAAAAATARNELLGCVAAPTAAAILTAQSSSSSSSSSGRGADMATRFLRRASALLLRGSGVVVAAGAHAAPSSVAASSAPSPLASLGSGLRFSLSQLPSQPMQVAQPPTPKVPRDGEENRSPRPPQLPPPRMPTPKEKCEEAAGAMSGDAAYPALPAPAPNSAPAPAPALHASGAGGTGSSVSAFLLPGALDSDDEDGEGALGGGSGPAPAHIHVPVHAPPLSRQAAAASFLQLSADDDEDDDEVNNDDDQLVAAAALPPVGPPLHTPAFRSQEVAGTGKGGTMASYSSNSSSSLHSREPRKRNNGNSDGDGLGAMLNDLPEHAGESEGTDVGAFAEGEDSATGGEADPYAGSTAASYMSYDDAAAYACYADADPFAFAGHDQGVQPPPTKAVGKAAKAAPGAGKHGGSSSSAGGGVPRQYPPLEIRSGPEASAPRARAPSSEAVAVRAGNSARRAVANRNRAAADAKNGAGNAEEEENDDDADDEDGDDDPCMVCMQCEPGDDDPMLYCDGPCGGCFHLSCLALPNSVLEQESYLCDSCYERKHVNGYCAPRCCLCNRPNGPMRKSKCGKWVHLMCVLFTPELTVDDRMCADNLAALDPDRRDLACLYCRAMGGACVQCKHGDCLRAYHPFCAYEDACAKAEEHGACCGSGGAIGAVRMDMLLFPGMDGVEYVMYCPKHDPRNRGGKRRGAGGGVQPAEESPNDAQLVDSPADADDSAEAAHGSKRQRVSKNKGKKQLRARGRLSRSPLTAHKGVKRAKGDKQGPPRGAAAAAAGTIGQKSSRKRLKSLVDKFFADEASVSGTEDDRDGEGSDDSDGELSGNFINDGVYTQTSENSDPMAMYYKVNRQLEEVADRGLYAGAAGEGTDAAALSRFGFRGARDGLPLLERVLRKQQRTEHRREEAKAAGAGTSANGGGGAAAAQARKRTSDGPGDRSRGGAKRAAMACNTERGGADDDTEEDGEETEGGEETEAEAEAEEENKERGGFVAAAAAAAAANALKAQQLQQQQHALMQQQQKLLQQQRPGQVRRKPALQMAALPAPAPALAPAIAPAPPAQAPVPATTKAFSAFLAVDDDDDDW